MNSMLNNWPIDPAVVIIALGVITLLLRNPPHLEWPRSWIHLDTFSGKDRSDQDR